jgi:hypothetical protein
MTSQASRLQKDVVLVTSASQLAVSEERRWGVGSNEEEASKSVKRGGRELIPMKKSVGS